jgi:hypothetical protein
MLDGKLARERINRLGVEIREQLVLGYTSEAGRRQRVIDQCCHYHTSAVVLKIG